VLKPTAGTVGEGMQSQTLRCQVLTFYYSTEYTSYMQWLSLGLKLKKAMQWAGNKANRALLSINVICAHFTSAYGVCYWCA